MKAIFDHEKLRVYRQSVEFVGWVGALLDSLPQGKLAVRDHLDRASTSVVLNIAEGNGKRSHPDRCRFLDIARGSAVECAACLDVLVVRGKISVEFSWEGKNKLIGIVSMLAGLISRFGGNDSGPLAVSEPLADYSPNDLVLEENE